MILTFIQENSGGADDAADIFQDALIVLFEKVRDPNFELTCHIKTYIYSICRNLWLKRLNKKKKQATLVDTMKAVELEPQIAQLMEKDEDAKMVAQLLKKIGGDAEKLLVHFYFEGLKTKEVTEKMGYANEQVTRNKKSKCLKKLRELLQDSPLIKQFRP